MKQNNKTEVTSVKLVLLQYVMSFETLTKVDQLKEIVKFGWDIFKPEMYQMTSEFIHKEISMLICSEKYLGGGGGW